MTDQIATLSTIARRSAVRAPVRDTWELAIQDDGTVVARRIEPETRSYTWLKASILGGIVGEAVLTATALVVDGQLVPVILGVVAGGIVAGTVLGARSIAGWIAAVALTFAALIVIGLMLAWLILFARR